MIVYRTFWRKYKLECFFNFHWIPCFRLLKASSWSVRLSICLEWCSCWWIGLLKGPCARELYFVTIGIRVDKILRKLTKLGDYAQTLAIEFNKNIIQSSVDPKTTHKNYFHSFPLIKKSLIRSSSQSKMTTSTSRCQHILKQNIVHLLWLTKVQ